MTEKAMSAGVRRKAWDFSHTTRVSMSEAP